MKASAQNLCNNILFRAYNEKIPITPMKLQKILYYICTKYVKETGVYPIFERFEVWKYGPVIPSVYAEFRPFGSSPIKGYAYDAQKRAMIVDENANPILKKCINQVWDSLKTFNGIELATRTHQKGSGWYSAYKNGQETISMEEMMNDTTI